MFNFLKLFFIICFVCFYISGDAFFEIVEVMPNTLDDKNLEYITLKNTSDTAHSLSGYILADKKKEYIFIEDVFLLPDERKEFFRPETKIVLNNNDEEIFLYNPQGEIIDEISYETSVKGDFLIFEEINKNLEDDIISQEVFISGEIFISDEVTEEVIVIIEEKKEVPEIKISLQRPSYIDEFGGEDIFYCDNEKDECKVNFDLRESFSHDFPERDYMCEIDFGIGVIMGQELKCNPNTIIFPQGEFEVIFKIFHEDDKLVFIEKKIYVKNLPFSTQNPIILDKGDDEPQKIPNIYIYRPEIIVQSGLTGEGRYFYCEKQECKINLNYEKRHKDERCYWNFAHMEQSSETTHTRCNPGYITVLEGIHDMSLKVYEKGNEENSKTVKFYIYNQEQKMLSLSLEKGENLEESGKIEKEIILDEFKIEIQLQGKISTEKILSGSTLICNGVEKCYVNFEGIIEGNINNNIYIWKLNNEIFSEKLNPKGIWIEGEGTHKIVFQVGDIIQNFEIIIKPKALPILKTDNGENVKEDNKIGNIDEKIKFTQNFLVLKYAGLRISGLAPIGSKVEIYNQGEKIIEGISDEKGKYRLVSKDFKALEYIFDTKIILESGEEVFLQESGSFILLSEKRNYWFIPEKSSSSSPSSKKITIPKLILEAAAQDIYIDDSEKTLGLGKNILLVLLISLLAIFGVLHLIYIQIGNVGKNISNVYMTTFSTRQKICLILG